jgi:solute:Na+ symporter, SSS family
VDPFLFFFFFLGFAMLYAIVGIHASRTFATTTDYFLANRNLGLFSITLTLIATQLGGGMLLGTAEEAYYNGIVGITYTLGVSFGFLLLGMFFAPRLQQLNVVTVAELFETRYNSPTLKKIASILSIITMVGILIAQIVASKKFIASLGFDSHVLFIIFWLLTIAYTVLGGFAAVVITDIYQASFIIIVFGILFVYHAFSTGAPLSMLPALQSSASGMSYETAGTLVSALFMPMLFALIEQDLAQRFFASRTPFIARMSALLSTAFMVVFAFIPIYFGIQARLIDCGTECMFQSPLIPMIASFCPDFIVALTACAVIAAITSTADSLLCAIGSHIVQDFDIRYMTNMNAVLHSQYVVGIVGAVALICSYFVPQHIIGILTSSYELSVSCLLVPLVICYFTKNVKKTSAIGAIIGGLFGFIGFRLYYQPVIAKELITLTLSLAGYLIGLLV